MLSIRCSFGVVVLSLAFQLYSATSRLSILQGSHLLLSFSVAQFGATGDVVHYYTFAIQNAIDECFVAVVSSRHSPCHITFPPGKYLTATLHLKSGVVRDISKNATILGGSRLRDIRYWFCWPKPCEAPQCWCASPSSWRRSPTCYHRRMKLSGV